jgi:PilZ domain
MSEPIQERRRFARHETAKEGRLGLPVVHDVELVDISHTGLLFSCTGSLKVGQRAQVRVLLGREPFSASIEVVRIERETLVPRNAGRIRFGAIFTAVDENSQRNLQRFLRDESKFN